MDYFKMYVTFRDDAKVLRLSDRAYREHVNAMCWTTQHESDGCITVVQKGRWVNELVAVGLWEATSDPAEYQIHNWLGRNRGHEEMENIRAERSESGRRGGEAKAKQRASKEPATTRQVARQLLPRSSSKDVAELELEKELEEEPNPTSAFTEDAHSLNLLLVAALRERGVKRIPGDLRSWEQSAERLLRIDAAPLDEVRRVLVFSQTDPFWAANILSMPKFRAKYDQLRLRMQSGNGRREETSAERVVRLGLA